MLQQLQQQQQSTKIHNPEDTGRDAESQQQHQSNSGGSGGGTIIVGTSRAWYIPQPQPQPQRGGGGVTPEKRAAKAEPKKGAEAPNQSREVAVFEGHQTKKQKVSIGQPTTVVKVHAPLGFLGFILKPKKSNRAIRTITKIDKACVVKGQIKVGDQLIGVNDDYFPYFLTQDLAQCMHQKQTTIQPCPHINFPTVRE